MGLSASASYSTVTPGDGGFAIADARNTLSFDPNRFFDLGPGITAKADGLLVDNTLPFFTTTTTVVPEPESLALFALGLVGLGWMRRRGWVSGQPLG